MNTELFYSLRDMVCFSIPEMIITTVLTYIFMEKYNLLERYNIVKSVINVLIPSAISSIIMTTLNHFNLGIMSKIIGLVSMYLMLLYVIKSNSVNSEKVSLGKLAFKFLLAFIIMMFIECMCAIILIFLLGTNLKEMLQDNNNFSLKFITSLSWMISGAILSIFLYKKQKLKLKSMLNIIAKKKDLLRITLILVFIMVIAIFLFIKFILFENIYSMNVLQHSISIIIFLSIFLLNILFINVNVIILINDEKKMQQLYHENDIKITEDTNERSEV